ncbi:uncharacterized protein L3040_007903 [Drepanopeziza brunnea f. sp. 'multigermtubi']|uniref:Uncharacterized protein n=1 Tax=Marssonina brunnea f. sp. multigermtubi (strain MB_m1) TaxID=1072389 RepID=K1WMM8_MARBU|nr:uncharacterized protein MBM_07773 [Drepanopeziza brunnea f. sp. 'multigermtubi' MB_m1]EKD14096.1 hypothetical protein MBM_07773 [Drepanopeziza brunnea f. sp. 'multigermtubi' MB_m1]KAJ5035435.1 hypothetical protein L3040_007903 [Drepanopeziza brunnea f. sp. 'multigermtubi']
MAPPAQTQIHTLPIFSTFLTLVILLCFFASTVEARNETTNGTIIYTLPPIPTSTAYLTTNPTTTLTATLTATKPNDGDQSLPTQSSSAAAGAPPTRARGNQAFFAFVVASMIGCLPFAGV